MNYRSAFALIAVFSLIAFAQGCDAKTVRFHASMKVPEKDAQRSWPKTYVETLRVRQFDVVELVTEQFEIIPSCTYTATEVGNLFNCELVEPTRRAPWQYNAARPGVNYVRIGTRGATLGWELATVGIVKIIVEPRPGKSTAHFDREKDQLEALETMRGQIPQKCNDIARLASCGSSSKVQERARNMLNDAKPALLAGWKKNNYKDAPSLTLAYFKVADAVPVLKNRILKPIDTQADPDKAALALGVLEGRKAIPFLVTLPIWDHGISGGPALFVLEDICTLPDYIKECQNYSSWRQWWEKRASALYHVPQHKF